MNYLKSRRSENLRLRVNGCYLEQVMDYHLWTKQCYNLYPGELGRGTEDDCTAHLNSLTSAAHGSEVSSKGNVAGNGKKGKNVLEKNTAAEIKKVEKLEQEHPAMQDIDSESEEEDVVGASFDWTGDSTLTLDDNWKDSIEKK